jgi:hypothetical protein
VPAHGDIDMNKEDISLEIVDLHSKLTNLNGDPYWIALYRIKELAFDLATLIIKEKDNNEQQ